jgi:hypothetical protein
MAQRLVGGTQGGGDVLVQRRCFGGVDLTEVSVHLRECASPTHGWGALLRSCWHPDDSRHCNDHPRPFTWHHSAEEILDRLAGYCRSRNNQRALQPDRTLSGLPEVLHVISG